MIVNCTTNGDVMTIAVEGRIDTTTAPELDAEKLVAVITEAGYTAGDVTTEEV